MPRFASEYFKFMRIGKPSSASSASERTRCRLRRCAGGQSLSRLRRQLPLHKGAFKFCIFGSFCNNSAHCAWAAQGPLHRLRDPPPPRGISARFQIGDLDAYLRQHRTMRLRHLTDNLCPDLGTFSCNTQSITAKKFRHQNPNSLASCS